MKVENMSLEAASKLKEEANEYFKSGNYEKALSISCQALSICKDDNLTSVLHKNAAASCLKLQDYDGTIKHCDKALDIKPGDPKALYRRATAFEALDRFEEAYRDAQKALVSSPSDANTFKPMLSRLHPIVESRKLAKSRTKEKANRMIQIAFGDKNYSPTQEEMETGLNNILVLCRERAGIQALLEFNLLQKLKTVIEIKKPSAKEIDRKIMSVRIISQIIQTDSSLCKQLLSNLGVPFVVGLHDITYGATAAVTEEAHTVVQYLWQKIVDALIGIGGKNGDKIDQQLLNENQSVIDTFFITLAMSLNSRTIPAEARDAIMQIFIKNIDYTVIPWGEKFIEVGALTRLADVGAEVPQLKIESCMNVTGNTRNLAAGLFTKIYDNMYYDAAREKYSNCIDAFIKEMLLSPEVDAKLRATALLTTLLMGPVDVGNSFIGRPGILQMILVMANSDEYLQQLVATEAIVAAASKKDKAKSIITEGINILKRLYQSKNDEIKVRALVGICKLGSTGGTDATIRPFSEGSTLKLAEACRRFLLNPAKDVSTQRWAVEGLSYLSLDAEVKEKLVEDTTALKTLLEISTHASKCSEIVYPIVTCLVNLVNAYEKAEIIPEMLELAKFAKQHVPEEHEFDDPDFVEQRVHVLAKLGVTSCLVNLSVATESGNVRELIARILNAICEKDKLRGLVVAQGGARELVKIALKSTDKGKVLAAQAIARIGVNHPPSVAFPGQRMFEVIKPLISLLALERKALENFEALLTLANIAAESEACRNRIFEESGFMQIEHYMYEDHVKLRMAAVQCMLNLCLSDKAVKCFEGDNDRVKFIVLLASPNEDLDEEDKDEIETMKAAAGVLAILSSQSRIVCGKILTCVKSPMDMLVWLVANPLIDLQLRGVTIVRNIITCDPEFARQIVGSNLFELVMALCAKEETEEKKSKLKKEDLKKLEDIKSRCVECLKAAEEHELIKKS